jgi:hypothetical protein
MMNLRKIFFPDSGMLYTTGFLYLIFICSAFLGCYSFKGGSVPPHLKTIAIPVIEDRSGFGEPLLRDSFTQQLVDRFTNDNSLQLTDRNSADSMLEGMVTDVKDMPAILEGSDKVSERRITITVKMTYQDLKLRKKIWEKTYTDWGNYSTGGGLTERNTGVQEAIRKLTEIILNDTVAGW